MNCAVLENRTLAPGFFYLSLRPDAPVGLIAPGQFVMIRCSHSTDPLLRRPMSVADSEPDGSRFGLVIQVAGRGTRLLSGLVRGDRVDALGPFGTGFDVSAGGSVWIVAGGTGVAPFMGLVGRSGEAAGRYTIFLGARSASQLLFRDFFDQSAARLHVATEDGSEGHGGLVTELFEEWLDREPAPEAVFSCGPTPMMRALAGVTGRHALKLYVSLENRMACGFGACLGCVTKARREQRYVTVCRKGPVFSATDVEI